MSLHAENDRLSAWVGSLPEGWRCDWLKWHVDCSTARPTDEQQTALPYLSNEDIESWTGRLLREDLVPAEADSRLFKAGDVLFNKLRPYLAKVFHAEFDGVSSGELLCLRPSDRVDARYLFYVLTSHGLIDSVDAQTFGSKMPRADWEIIGHQPLPLPHIDVQRRIANFLDEKTAQIDALIDKKHALLELLAEQRQALITRAVTRGINPNAPMKSSGVSWLGDVPEHWSLIPFKWRCRVRSGQVDPREIPYCSLPLVAPDHIESSSGRLIEEVKSAEDQGAISGKYLCFPGDVLYSKIRPSLRKVCLFGSMCLCSADMYAIDSGEEIEKDFLFYFLLTDAFSCYAELESMRVAMPKVNRESIGAFVVPIPGRQEQSEIVRKCKEIDEDEKIKSWKLKLSISTLMDYRSALITSAITGQLPELNG